MEAVAKTKGMTYKRVHAQEDRRLSRDDVMKIDWAFSPVQVLIIYKEN